jgi:hypothetical protein
VLKDHIIVADRWLKIIEVVAEDIDLGVGGGDGMAPQNSNYRVFHNLQQCQSDSSDL